MVMSASSAAFLAENFAGTVSVFAGAPGTAKAPLTNAAVAGGAALVACELGSSLPIWPDGVCCALSCCDCCCASAAGGCCWAAARPTLATNASASALVRKRSFRMAVSFFSARADAICPSPCAAAQPARLRALGRARQPLFRRSVRRHNRRGRCLVSWSARGAVLIGDLGDDDAGRGIDQQQAVVDDHVSVRPYGRHRADDRLRHRRQRISIADP